MKYRLMLWSTVIALALTITPAMRAQDASSPWSHRELPEYPSLLRNLKIGGNVKLAVVLGNDGKVKQATVKGGNPMLAELSCMAVKKWIYAHPATDNKVNVELVFDPKAGVAFGAVE